jgi:hypothetical protein
MARHLLATMSLAMNGRQQNQERLQRMIRRTMRVVGKSTEVLQQTNKLLNQFRALTHVRIKRPDNPTIQK